LTSQMTKTLPSGHSGLTSSQSMLNHIPRKIFRPRPLKISEIGVEIDIHQRVD
jgi:hypothetical protein